MAYVSITVDKGLDLITAALAASAYKYIAWGVGTDEADAAETALNSASAEARTSGTQTQQDTGGTTKDTYQVVGTIVCAGAGKAITEVGLFDADAAGNMMFRANFAVINVNVSDSVEFTLQQTFNQV